ncbi:MAG: hypothetical protein IJX91_02545 [Clostridia bacterium]|nr:hypothetical protein [Clostridia bacterium]
MKKVLALIMAFTLVASFAACGGGGNTGSTGGGSTNTDSTGGSKPTVERDPSKAKKIVIYTGGSSEFFWSAGTKEQEVWDAVEEAFYNDYAVNVDFQVNFYGKDMKDKINAELTAGGQVDVVMSHTGGGDGIDDWMFNNDQYYDLYDLIDEYGANIYQYSTWTQGDVSLDALTRLTTFDKQVVGIPSVINPYKFGILVRKDLMEAAGYTDDAAKVSEGYKLVDNLETFEEMALAIVNADPNDDVKYATTGAIFDLEKAGLLGAYGLDAGYYTSTVDEATETFGAGFMKEGYGDVLELENRWAKNGVISGEADTILLSDGENNFISGKTAIFVQDPSINHLIQVARKAKARNPEAEFTVLGALTKDANSTAKGFMRNSVATFAACVSKTSQCAKEIVQFINWMYEDPANYLLCKYGVEGKHWIDNGDNTYSYANESDYINPPYSGVLSLVENQNVANYTYAGYTEEELSWIATAQDKSNYIDNDTVDYFLLTDNMQMNTELDTGRRYMYNFCQTQVWSGANIDVKAGFANNRAEYLKAAAYDSENSYGKYMYQLYKALSGK